MNILKRNFVNKIIEGLNNLNGTEFEYMSKDFFKLILKSEIIHKGHTITAKPSGYTADFHDSGNKYVSQCGTDDDYFEGFTKDKKGNLKKDISEEKPIIDFVKTAKRYPDAKIIYLFSNRLATGNKNNEVIKAIDIIKAKENFTQDIELYDAQRIGELFYTNANSTLIVEPLLEKYLSNAYELYKVLPSTNQLPEFKGTFYERSETDEVISSLQSEDVIQIYGLSGIGKTELSISIANKIRSDYHTIIWIDTDLHNEREFDFYNVKLSKFDNRINLAYILENYKILLIFDNRNSNVGNIKSTFENHNKMNSKCLITSLSRALPNSNSFQLSYLEHSIAKNILFNTTKQPTEEQAEKLLTILQGYPLILKIIVSNIELENFTWSDIIENLASIGELTDDDRNQTLANVVIGRIKSNLKKELGFIRYLKNRKISRDFTKFALNILLNKLVNASIIYQQDLIHFDIHQIVLDAIVNSTELDDYNSEYDIILKNYLIKNNEIKSFDYFNFIYTHHALLENKWKNADDDELKKVIFYALIQATDINNNPAELLAQFDKIKLTYENYYDILLEIERGEIELFTIDKRADREKYIEKGNEVIENLKLILENTNINKIIIHLYHHIGKLYFKIDNLLDAKSYFDKVLQLDEKADYAILQKARIYHREREYNKAIEEIEKVLGDKEILDNISVNILLSFYELISYSQYNQLKDKYILSEFDEFVKNIFSSIDEKFDQPFRILKGLAKTISYFKPDEYKEIVNNLPMPSNISTNRDLKISYAEIQSAYYRYLKYQEPDNEVEKGKSYSLAFNYFNDACLKNDFEKKQLLSLFIDAEEFDKALLLIDTYSDKENAFYYQNLCKIYRGLGKYDEALEWIDKAINCNVQVYHLAAFFNDKAEVLKANGNIDEAIINLEKAINKQGTAKTKQNWKNKLNDWKI